ncbi:MAG: outer membrane protein assembly factor BamB [Pseudomonadales bacterium]|nr:outer membrane protein assembly factor BamB [Pseudomonadales bacterium]
MIFFRNWLFFLGLCLLLSGCSWFSWLPWVDEKSEEVKKPAKLVSFKPSVRIAKQWSKKIGSGLGKKYVRLTPKIVADQIIVADAFGQVASFNRFSGKPNWRSRVGAPAKRGMVKSLQPIGRKDLSFVSGGVGTGEGIIVLGTTSGEVIALSVSDGSEKWRTNVSSEVLSAPAVGRDLVYVQSNDGRLAGLDLETGERRWRFDSQVPLLTLRGSSSPVLGNGLVYTGFSNGKVIAFQDKTGEQMWQQRIMLPQGRSDLERIVDVDGSPLLAGNMIYAVSFQGRLKALRASDGAVLWERDASSFLDLSSGYGQVYLVDVDDSVVAIEASDATEVWTQSGLSYRKLSSPLAFNNYLVVGDDEGYLHVLAQSDGRFLGRKKINSSGFRSNMLVADGILYCYANDGKLTALSITALN